jgi:ribose 5-phosphate isomerase A
VNAVGPPVPLELLAFGAGATLSLLEPARLRDVPRSPDGGLLADYLGPVDDAQLLAGRFSAAPGVVEHGLFEPELVDEIVVAREGGVEWFARESP